MSVLINTHLLLPATELATLKDNAFKRGGVRGSSNTVGENSSFSILNGSEDYSSSGSHNSNFNIQK